MTQPMKTPAKRAVAFLRRSLKPAGLDVVIPLTLERYNAFLEQDATAASDLSQYILPVPMFPPPSEEGSDTQFPPTPPTSPTSPTSLTPTPTTTTPPPTPTPTPPLSPSSTTAAPTPTPTPTPPVSPTSTRTPTPTRTRTPVLSQLNSHLLVLVGNSRALWEPFLAHVADEIEREGRVFADPIDRYVKQSVERVLATCEVEGVTAPVQTYWVADTEPGKMILAQKMAVAAHAVTRCPPSQICLHPVYGPWLALRCAFVFPLEGIPDGETDGEETGEEEEEEAEGTSSPPVPAECDHDEDLHAVLASQMAEALGQVSKDKPTEISPDAWKTWVLPRITIAPSHAYMYSNEQILYHYTKDTNFLARVVKAKQLSLSTDYLRDAPPPAAMEFRELLQTVLQGWTLPYPDGVDAIALSGGLDTSILAEASAQPWQTAHGDGVLSLDKAGAAKPILSFKHAFTLQADPQAQDAAFARGIFNRLAPHSIQHQHILDRSLDDLLQHTPRVAKLLVTCDPMELRNSLVIYATLEEAARCGVRQIVTGDGADEIFCGYAFYATMDESAMLAYRDQIMDVMGFTAPTLARSFGIDVIAPFLDKRVLAFAKKLCRKDLVGERTPVPVEGPGVEYGKLVMRQAFPEAFSQWRWKEPIEQGAGTTALRLGYFDAYCTVEEFDAAQRDAMTTHGVLVRDKEHLFFFRAFLEAFENDLGKVPKPRKMEASTTTTGSDTAGYCPACGFQLSHAAQDFCVTCGFWPTCATPTNDSQGFATQALAKLARDKQRLLALME